MKKQKTKPTKQKIKSKRNPLVREGESLPPILEKIDFSKIKTKSKVYLVQEIEYED